MAAGDLTVFDEAKLALLDGTHDLDTHVIKLAICDNTVAPTAGTASRDFFGYRSRFRTRQHFNGPWI